jgi:DNA-directed RNA polymerase
MQAFQGGYYMLREPILRRGRTQHTAALENPIGAPMIQALNLIQATPYAIDTFIAYWQKEAYERNDAVAGIPLAEPLPLPRRFPDDVWAAMSKEERTDHKARASMIHDENASMIGKRLAFKRKLKLAFELAEEPAIYFPCNFDFRLRLYPIPQDLTPQGDDIAKSLLRFAEGKPLGRLGAYWLCVAIANAFGQDKISLEDRVAWTMENANLLLDSVDQPLDGRRFWAEADEPWCALALAHEFSCWIEHGDDFVSYRPINVDATCSGMQHLSALARDPIGALATNLTRSPDRQDIYLEVAQEANRQVERDAAAGDERAQAWLGHVTRKTVKRAVMTTPYGVTDRGIRDQLIADPAHRRARWEPERERRVHEGGHQGRHEHQGEGRQGCHGVHPGCL